MPRRDAHSPAWEAFSHVSVGVPVAMAVLGVACPPRGPWERGHLGMAALLPVHALVPLARTAPDRRDAGNAGAVRAEGVR